MKSKKKKIWIPIIAIFSTVIVVGILVYFINKTIAKDVNVYSVSELSMEDYDYDNMISGIVTSSSTKSIQAQTGYAIKELFVNEGDTVAAGDRLFSYDMTKVELQLDIEKLSKQRLELQKKIIEQEINELNTLANTPYEPQIDEETGEILDEEFQEEPIDYQKAISEKRQELKENALDTREATLRISKIERQLESDIVTSTVDGVVSGINNSYLEESRQDNEGMEEDYNNNETKAFLEIRYENATFIQGTISEYQFEELQVGTRMIGTSYNSGAMFETEITEISNYPTENNGANNFGMGDNASYYQFTARVIDEIDLVDQEYIDLKVIKTEEESITIEKMFVRSEGGNHFVFVQDEDGKLVRKKVNVLQFTNYGTCKISAGLLETDYIAFPYGNAVKDGANTRVAQIEELYY